jgi:general secretion pathway protein J
MRVTMQRRACVRRAAAGFTLVEVLVAMFIMAVLAGLAWRGIDGLLRARDASQALIERSTRLNTVLIQWEQDLAALHDTAVVPPLSYDGRTLRLTRTAEGGVRLVAWSLRANAWQRWAGPVHSLVGPLQESWLASQQLLGNEAGQLRVLEGVDEWQVYFYRGNAWTNAQSSGDVVAPPAGGASAPASRDLLPGAVRLVLTLAGNNLTRDIALGPQTQ